MVLYGLGIWTGCWPVLLCFLCLFWLDGFGTVCALRCRFGLSDSLPPVAPAPLPGWLMG